MAWLYYTNEGESGHGGLNLLHKRREKRVTVACCLACVSLTFMRLLRGIRSASSAFRTITSLFLACISSRTFSISDTVERRDCEPMAKSVGGRSLSRFSVVTALRMPYSTLGLILSILVAKTHLKSQVLAPFRKKGGELRVGWAYTAVLPDVPCICKPRQIRQSSRWWNDTSIATVAPTDMPAQEGQTQYSRRDRHNKVNNTTC